MTRPLVKLGRVLCEVNVQSTVTVFVDVPDDWADGAIEEYALEHLGPRPEDFQVVDWADGFSPLSLSEDAWVDVDVDGTHQQMTASEYRDWLTGGPDPKAPKPGQLDIFGGEVQ